jgi:hypothetical protein
VEIIHSPQVQQSAAAAIFDLQLSAREALIAGQFSIHPRGSYQQQQPYLAYSCQQGQLLIAYQFFIHLWASY